MTQPSPISGAAKKSSLCLVNNIPSPYRRVLFDEIAEIAPERSYDLSVLYLSETESVRQWTVDLRAFETVLPVLWRKRNQRTTTGDVIVNRGVIIRGLRPRQVILFGYNYPSYMIIAVTRAIFQRPTHLFCETTLSDKAPTAWKMALKAFLFRTLFRRFLVPGKRSADYLLAHGVKAQDIFFAPNASPIRPASTRVPPGEGTLRLLFVGRLAAEKRMLDFARIFFEIETEHRLTIVGDGPESGPISEVAQRADNITMLGALDPSELSDVYVRHNVLVLVSESEPWGLVVNEAVNHGLALLLSPQVGSAPDLLDGNGTYLENLAPEALSAALDQVKRNLTSFCARSLEIAEETTVERQATAFLDFAARSEDEGD